MIRFALAYKAYLSVTTVISVVTQNLCKIMQFVPRTRAIAHTSRRSPSLLRPTQTRKHCCRNISSQCCSHCCMGQLMGKKQTISCFRDANSTSSKDVAWVHKRVNNRETFKVSVSQILSRWRPHAAYVEDTKSSS